MSKNINYFSPEIKNTWLGKTNQLWKMWTIFVFELIALALIIVGFTYKSTTLIFTGFFIGLMGMLILTFFFRCPKCKKSIGLKIIAKADINNYISDFFLIKECPICKYTPE